MPGGGGARWPRRPRRFPRDGVEPRDRSGRASAHGRAAPVGADTIGRAMRGHWIGGRWVVGEGPTFDSEDPATGRPCWNGRAASAEEVAAAAVAARKSCE